MAYDAITLDTNIFRQNGYRLEGGMLALLNQFKDGPVRFVLSEIVLREVERHLVAAAKEGMSELARAITTADSTGVILEDALQELRAIHAAAQIPEDAVKARLDAFKANTGVEVVPADQTNIAELVERYFSIAAPFESTGKKKNEFPDAIALLSLENWANANQKKVLAISADGGWGGYANTCDCVDVENNLRTALESVQQHVEQASEIVGKLLARMDADEAPDLLQQIVDRIADAVSDLDVHSEYAAATEAEPLYTHMKYEDVVFVRDDGNYDFSIVEIGRDWVIAGVNVRIKATAEAEFQFSVWDSVDKEAVPLGSNVVAQTTEFDATALITFVGNLQVAPDVIEASSVELVGVDLELDFGDVDLGENFYK